jgi:4-nitrophenyl phosphatase
MLPSTIKSLILDMDGVLWKADAPIGDLKETFDLIHKRGFNVAFATNNGTLTPEMYIERLARFGVVVEAWQVVTSSLVAAHLLSQSLPTGTPIFVIGESGLLTALTDKGFIPVTVEDAGKAKAVVMGVDRGINYIKMSEAALLIRKGVPFIVTNPDKSFPTTRGEIPGAGAWASVIITATGIQPIYAGKPAPALFEMARERLGTTKKETLVVGDRLETDIAGGQANGCPVALVLSGVSTQKQGAAWRPALDFIAEDLYSLIKLN